MSADWQSLPKRDDESEAGFIGRKFDELSEHPGFGFSIIRQNLENMGIDDGFLRALPAPPENVILCLDIQTANILAFSLPKGMDIFTLLEKAKE